MKKRIDNEWGMNKKKGFTLVELLISISILSIAILASYTAVSNNLRSANFSQDQMVAYYLADEGIEYVRNVRDQNGIQNIHSLGGGGGGVPWLTGIAQIASDPCYNKYCTVDSPLNAVSTCSGGASSCPYLRYDATSGLYGYTGTWTLTQFQRSISITINSATEATLTSTVTWVTNGVTKSYVLTEILRAWQ